MAAFTSATRQEGAPDEGDGRKRDMTFIEAAAEVLRQAGKPLHYKEITELAIARNLLSHVGKTPEVTMSHRLTSAIRKDDKDIPIVKLRPGIFALRDWEGKKGKKGALSTAAETPAEEGETSADDADSGVNALEIEAAVRGSERRGKADIGREENEDEDDQPSDRQTPVTGEDALRADLAASGAELFDDEEDDDQPILAPASSASQVAPGAEPLPDASRRRRRRRRRGRGGSQADSIGPAEGRPSAPRGGEPRFASGGFGERSAAQGGDGRSPGASEQGRSDGAIQPTPIASIDNDSNIEVREFAPGRAVVRDRQQIMAAGQPTGIEIAPGEGEELAGRELADAAVVVLSSFDRSAGPAPTRAVAEALMRRGRLQGDPVLAVAQASAAMRADNLRRSASGLRQRFRFATGNRVALTDWTLGGELPRLEQEAVAAVDRYREASRRALLRKLQELPGHALIELVLVALERVGMTNLRAVRRAGSPGGEAHFAAIHKTGADSIPTAIAIRKDGRELGRERVTDLRGALHHYGPASAGWLVTTGQCLTGAREEAAAPGAAPVALYDGIALCKLLEDIDVAVIKTRLAIAIPDLELLETLRG
jgi:HB1, ASXL, restriction endonuclease HTH domain/Restriction endonuclease